MRILSLTLGALFALGLLAAPRAVHASDTGSIAVAKDAEVDIDLLMKAMIPLSMAFDTALAASPGKVVAAEFGPRGGFLVFGFDIVGADGKTTYVKIDAGNGEVLALDSVRADGSVGKIAPGDSTMVPGSIRLEPGKHLSRAAMADLAKVSLYEAVVSAGSHGYGATMVAAVIEESNGFLVYGVDLMNLEDLHRYVTVDAGTGNLLSVQGEGLLRLKW